MLAAERDTIAESILSMAQLDEQFDIEPEYFVAVMEGMAQADQGEFVEGAA